MKRIVVPALLAATCCGATAHADFHFTAGQIAKLAGGGRAQPLADSRGRLPVVLYLPPGEDGRSFGAVPMGPGLASFRASADEVSRLEAAHPGLGFSVWPPFRPVLDQSAKLNRTTDYRALLAARGAPGGRGQGVLVGIIDTGIDAAHADFRDASGKTRIAWLLDMDHAALGLHPDVETEFHCADPMQTPCAVLSGADIDGALAGAAGPYVPRDLAGHGSHVASIAAGNGGADAKFVGGAPDARLIVVKVTHGTDESVSDADIVNAAKFIFERAESMAQPVAVNLSLGGDFGPHDGTSPVEKSLAAMVGPEHPGRALVVAAGNSGGLYQLEDTSQKLGIHTEVRVAAGMAARVPLLSPPEFTSSDLLAGKIYVWITFRAGDRVSVGVSGPAGLSLDPVSPGNESTAGTLDGKLTAVVFNDIDSNESGLTSDTHGAVVVWDGSWPPNSPIALDLEGDGFASMWLEGTGDAGVSSASAGEFFQLAERTGTIGVPGTHPDLIAVGCTVNRAHFTDSEGTQRDVSDNDLPSDSVSYFSAMGPTAGGVTKPDLTAPGEFVLAAMSHDATPAVEGAGSPFFATSDQCGDSTQCFVVDPAHGLLSGTSMSAPQVTGAIALLFERDPSLTQDAILKLLQEGARYPEGTVRFDYQLGAGALDVAGTMAAYDARSAPVVRDPDPEKSWMTLSDSYVHPDPAWPLVGLVALRTAKGELADGFDARRLALTTAGPAAVTTPLSRSGPGLYRFQLAAAPDSGGQSLDLDVTFDGRTLGAGSTSGRRTLGIGPDYWLTVGTIQAMGGCNVARPAGDAGAWPAIALLAFRGRRASTRTRAARKGARRGRTAT